MKNIDERIYEIKKLLIELKDILLIDEEENDLYILEKIFNHLNNLEFNQTLKQ